MEYDLVRVMCSSSEGGVLSDGKDNVGGKLGGKCVGWIFSFSFRRISLLVEMRLNPPMCIS